MNKLLAGIISPFNPGNINRDHLESLLVGRESIADELTNSIQNAAINQNSAPQHLVIAPRGYGKTHLVHVVYNRLVKSGLVGKRLVIALFREEEHVHSYLDFLRRVIEALNKETESQILKDAIQITYKSAQSEKALPAVEELLIKFIGDRLLVIMVENLGEVFDGLGKNGQQKLRALLQGAKNISLFATGQKLFEPVNVRTETFYGFFQYTNLQPLDEKQTNELLTRIAVLSGLKDLEEFLKTPLGISRAQVIYELTFGNPRLIVMLSGFLTRESIEELTSVFEQFVETSLTPYYQEQMARLAPLQRRIIEILCENSFGRGMIVKDIAEKALTTPQSISKQLQKMSQLGILYSLKDDKNKSATYYGMQEPLWRITIEVKHYEIGTVRIIVDLLKKIKSPIEMFVSLSELDEAAKRTKCYLETAFKETLRSATDDGKQMYFHECILEFLEAFVGIDFSKAEKRADRLREDFPNEFSETIFNSVRGYINKEEVNIYEGLMERKKTAEASLVQMAALMIQLAQATGKIKYEDLGTPLSYSIMAYLLFKREGYEKFIADTRSLESNEFPGSRPQALFNFSYAVLVDSTSGNYERSTDVLIEMLQREQTKGIGGACFSLLLYKVSDVEALLFMTKAAPELLRRVMEKPVNALRFIDTCFSIGEKKHMEKLFSIYEKMPDSDKEGLLLYLTVSVAQKTKPVYGIYMQQKQQIQNLISKIGINKFDAMAMLEEAERYASGDKSALASWPIEIRKIIENAASKVRRKNIALDSPS